MDSVAYLIGKKVTADSIGQQTETDETRTAIYITVSRVNRNEFFTAGRSGITPEYVFTTASVNYSGEKEIEYDGERYAVGSCG